MTGIDFLTSSYRTLSAEWDWVMISCRLFYRILWSSSEERVWLLFVIRVQILVAEVHLKFLGFTGLNWLNWLRWSSRAGSPTQWIQLIKDSLHDYWLARTPLRCPWLKEAHFGVSYPCVSAQPQLLKSIIFHRIWYKIGGSRRREYQISLSISGRKGAVNNGMIGYLLNLCSLLC